MPLTPTTLTRLDPAFPLLWRDGMTLQIGDDPAIRVPASAPWVERLLSRMRRGFRRSAFDVIAHRAGAPREEARRLLAVVEPALQDEPARPRAARVSTLGLTDARAEGRLCETLADEGVPLATAAAPSSTLVAVVLVPGAAAAVQFAPFLRTDSPHLPVAVEPARITVGPLVVPGLTPCLSCRDAEDTARDPAWPLLHGQLVGRDPGRVTLARVASAGAVAASLLADPEAARIARISADGAIGWRSVRFRAECLCRDPSSPSPPGTARAPVRRAPPIVPRTAPACAQPA